MPEPEGLPSVVGALSFYPYYTQIPARCQSRRRGTPAGICATRSTNPGKRGREVYDLPTSMRAPSDTASKITDPAAERPRWHLRCAAGRPRLARACGGPSFGWSYFKCERPALTPAYWPRPLGPIFHMPQAYFISGAARYFILGRSPNISSRLRL